MRQIARLIIASPWRRLNCPFPRHVLAVPCALSLSSSCRSRAGYSHPQDVLPRALLKLPYGLGAGHPPIRHGVESHERHADRICGHTVRSRDQEAGLGVVTSRGPVDCLSAGKRPVRERQDPMGKAALVMFDREAVRMQFSQADSTKRMVVTRPSGFKFRQPGL
jgi:hypothetical protein